MSVAPKAEPKAMSNATTDPPFRFDLVSYNRPQSLDALESLQVLEQVTRVGRTRCSLSRGQLRSRPWRPSYSLLRWQALPDVVGTRFGRGRVSHAYQMRCRCSRR